MSRLTLLPPNRQREELTTVRVNLCGLVHPCELLVLLNRTGHAKVANAFEEGELLVLAPTLQSSTADD